MSSYIRGYHPPMQFNISGLLTAYTIGAFVGGMFESPVGLRISGASMTEAIEGIAGTTAVQISKITTGGAVTAIVSLSLTRGGGPNSRTATNVVATEALRVINPTDRVILSLLSIQTVTGAEVSVTVFFGAS